VPVLLHAKYARVESGERVNEIDCIAGSLGRQPMVNLMPLVLANSLRCKSTELNVKEVKTFEDVTRYAISTSDNVINICVFG
jgi:hypothetical protein